MTPNEVIRECPYCKEDIKANAIRCKHCRSAVRPDIPPHGGICPLCKEEINSKAIKCKHCGAMLDGSAESSCCGNSGRLDASFKKVFEPDPQLPPYISESNPPSTGSSISRINCSPCVLITYGGTGYYGVAKICCTEVYIPFKGLQKVCWLDHDACPWYPSSGILV